MSKSWFLNYMYLVQDWPSAVATGVQNSHWSKAKHFPYRCNCADGPHFCIWSFQNS